MAKKKQNKKVSFYCSIICSVLAILAVAMITQNAVSIGDYSFTGIKLAFGSTGKILGIEVVLLKINVLVSIAFILPVIAAIVSFVKSKNSIIKLLPCVLFIISAVLLFMTTVFAPMGVANDTIKSLIENNVAIKLGVGPIIAAISCILAGLVSIYKEIK